MPSEYAPTELHRPIPGLEVIVWEGDLAEELLSKWFPVQFNSIDFVWE